MDYEEIKKFIKDNGIHSRTDLNKKFNTVYKKFLMLDESIKDELLPPLVTTITLNGLEEYNKFIKDNNILTRSQFYKNFPNVYKRFIRDLSKENQNIILPKLKNEYGDCASTYNYLKEYIKNNNIKSRTEFSNNCDVLYKNFLKLPENEQEELLPSSKFSKVKDFETFQKFIIDNNIISRKDLDKRFGRLYVKFLEIFTSDEQEKLLPSNREDLSSLVDYSGFLKFINKNNILSRRDFQKKSTAGYHRFKTILSEEMQDQLLPLCHTSMGELYLTKLFEENGIRFYTQKIFQNLLGKGNKPLRYDFYLFEYNILIEYHGQQHFDPEDNLYNDEAIFRDKKKFEYAKSNNIPLLYFTNEVEAYKKYGYFTEVITDSDILIQKIKEIGLTNQSNS